MATPSRPLDPWPSTEPLPSLLTDRDLMRVVQLRPARFYQLKAQGVFRRFEAKALTAGGTRYAGALVERLRVGDPISSFGRLREA